MSEDPTFRVEPAEARGFAFDETSSDRHGSEARPTASPVARLYRRFFGKLARDLRATYGPGPPDPEDVAQRAFEKLSQRPDIDDIRDPEGFVWISARNILITEKRAQRVRADNVGELERRFFGAACDEFDPERVFTAKEQLAIVMETLERMPERRRRIFMLNRVHGLTPEQAGRRCGVSRTAAVRHIAIAVAAIAEALDCAPARGGAAP